VRPALAGEEPYPQKQHGASMDTGAKEMGWEQWFCPNQRCGAESWMVKHSTAAPEIWQVACRFSGSSYTVAAVDPVCPRCGDTLCAAVELGQRRGAGGVLEAGPMLDFVRSLR